MSRLRPCPLRLRAGFAPRHSGGILAGLGQAAGPEVDHEPCTSAVKATMAAMPRRIRVVTWNGKDVPPEFFELPTGRYVVELIEEAPVPTPEEEAGIEAALESYRQGRVVYAKRALEMIGAAIGR